MVQMDDRTTSTSPAHKSLDCYLDSMKGLCVLVCMGELQVWGPRSRSNLTKNRECLREGGTFICFRIVLCLYYVDQCVAIFRCDKTRRRNRRNEQLGDEDEHGSWGRRSCEGGERRRARWRLPREARMGEDLGNTQAAGYLQAQESRREKTGRRRGDVRVRATVRVTREPRELTRKGFGNKDGASGTHLAGGN